MESIVSNILARIQFKIYSNIAEKYNYFRGNTISMFNYYKNSIDFPEYIVENSYTSRMRRAKSWGTTLMTCDDVTNSATIDFYGIPLTTSSYLNLNEVLQGHSKMKVLEYVYVMHNLLPGNSVTW